MNKTYQKYAIPIPKNIRSIYDIDVYDDWYDYDDGYYDDYVDSAWLTDSHIITADNSKSDLRVFYTNGETFYKEIIIDEFYDISDLLSEYEFISINIVPSVYERVKYEYPEHFV